MRSTFFQIFWTIIVIVQYFTFLRWFWFWWLFLHFPYLEILFFSLMLQLFDLFLERLDHVLLGRVGLLRLLFDLGLDFLEIAYFLIIVLFHRLQSCHFLIFDFGVRFEFLDLPLKRWDRALLFVVLISLLQESLLLSLLDRFLYFLGMPLIETLNFQTMLLLEFEHFWIQILHALHLVICPSFLLVSFLCFHILFQLCDFLFRFSSFLLEQEFLELQLFLELLAHCQLLLWLSLRLHHELLYFQGLSCALLFQFAYLFIFLLYSIFVLHLLLQHLLLQQAHLAAQLIILTLKPILTDYKGFDYCFLLLFQ